MPEEWRNQQPYRDTIKVPAVLQLPGAPFPTEFYARYPEAFRVPVRLVRRDGPAQPDAAPPRRTQVAPPPPSGGDAAWIETLAPEANMMDATAPVAASGSSYRGVDPVATFLRINNYLDHWSGPVQPGLEGVMYFCEARV
jgi:hypothetical protein